MGDLVLLLAHLSATLFMCGLIWTIQIVHYPMFDRVDHAGFAAFSKSHSGRISALLALPWGLEVATAIWLALLPPNGIDTLLPWLGLILVAGLMSVTMLVSAPLHSRLGNGFDAGMHRKLVVTNWIRTGLWSLRGAIAVVVMWQFVQFSAA